MYYSQQDAEKTAEYVIYLRKSREDIEAEKRGEMETLARHEKILNAVVEEQGLNVVKVYKELCSAETIQDRPGMQQLMKEVYAGKYAGVLVVKPDRLSRGDLENMGYILNGFKFSSTLLITPGMTYDVAHNKFHEQMLEMQLFNSKQEYRAITSRMQEGKLLSVREGNFLATSAPYGYDLSKPDKYTRTLVPNENAYIVQKIFDLFVNDRINVGEIARYLTAQGVPTLGSSVEWQRSTVEQIIKNPAYIGKVRWQNTKIEKEMNEDGKIEKRRRKNNKPILVEGKHPAIVDEEIFNKAQTLFSESAPTKSGKAIINPLAGLLVCAKCGRTLFYNNCMKHCRPRYAHPSSTVCFVKSASDKDVMDLLCQALREYISDFAFKLDNADKMEMAKKHSAEIEHLEKELEKAKQKRRRLFDDYEDGNYTAEEFRERKTVWANRIDNMVSQLETLQHTKPQEIDYQDKVVSFTNVLETLQDDTVSAKEKNILLKSIIDKILYSREGELHHGGKGGKITLEIILKD